MRRTDATGRPPRGLAALVLLLALGCGRSLPPPADGGRARDALRTALDAWKAGQKPDALRGRSPPIYFTDLRWGAGRRLLDYRLDDAAEPHGQSVRCSAVLTVEDDQGKTVDRKAAYLVDTGSSVVIVPADP